MMKWKENESESKEVVRGVYKRDKENSFPFILKGKWFSIIGRVILSQEKMVLHSFATKQCKTKNRGKQFSGKTFYALPNGA